jgi:hypothetical protein
MAQFGRRGSSPSDCRSYFFRLTYFCPIDWRRAIAQQLLNSGEDDLPLVIDKNLFIIGVQLTAGPASRRCSKARPTTRRYPRQVIEREHVRIENAYPPIARSLILRSSPSCWLAGIDQLAPSRSWPREPHA